jgi:hypothetical protein
MASSPDWLTRSNRRFRGLLLDFGGVLTTDFFASIDDHCQCLGLPRGRFRQLITKDPTGRALYQRIERGEISQATFEHELATLLGVDPEGLLAGLLGGLTPDREIIEAVARARGRHPGGGDHQLLGHRPLRPLRRLPPGRALRRGDHLGRGRPAKARPGHLPASSRQARPPPECMRVRR